MIKKTALAAAVLSVALVAPAIAKKNSNTEPYPYGNPVVTNMYTADAAPKVMPDGRVWMVTSVDHEDKRGYHNMEALHMFSTADMKNWVDHGTVLHTRDMPQGEDEDWAIWAPDMIYRNGTYYIYYPMRNVLEVSKGHKGKDRKIDRYVAVAESDRPDGGFEVTVDRMAGVPIAGLDPSVFIDDDGKAYLYYNRALMGVLNEDMRDLDGKPFTLNYGAKNFMEAAWMHKRGGKYYYNYHTKYDRHVDKNNPDDPKRKLSLLDYSMGDSATGPLEYMGVINHELGYGVDTSNGPTYPGKDYVPWRLNQSNHGAVIEFHGQEYFFYHTSALSSWRQDSFKAEGTWTQRSVCVDYLNYNDDGTAIPVQQTLEGVAAVTIDQPFSIKPELPAKGKGFRVNNGSVTAKDGAVIELTDMDFGTGYYYFGMTVEQTTPNGHIEVRRDSPDGMLMGTLLLRDHSMKINNARTETFLREAHGNDRKVYLVFRTEGQQVKVSAPDFFAGSPKRLPGDPK
ncbi:family 43 glycosylhydrolase [Echinimonas agarilytica]|uniref:Family 43 glycosylhydrolase n=1 Tax=Echinimonas agarilytica TaxID=1215918 RepID=A0AA41W5T4_9GAMM|nr:family 43 glycosylhydrolase [Echinimonas agarilytica]MCM2679157.1 family 43 glycosylhydrolase [Echinimonas agarilytica]